jgi:hypothetical protein
MSTNEGALVAFKKCQIEANIAERNGAVVYASTGSTAEFKNTDVKRNVAGAEGGAIFAEQAANLILEKSSFLGNNAFDSVVGTQQEAKTADGDHIYIASNDVTCTSIGNTFMEPFRYIGVVFSDGSNGCN